jgi:bifunctional DNA-binding transcriptional regulator/antitoxin component of YhaV-PrlF toxin-antitoxin module
LPTTKGVIESMAGFITKVCRAGRKAPATALKTYIPAEVVKKLKLEHGATLWWLITGRTVRLKVLRPKPAAKEIDTNLRQSR